MKMKSIYLTLVAAFAAIALTECGLIGKSQNVLSLTVVSADMNNYALWKVNVTALNSGKPLQLPLNSTETKGITFVGYETDYASEDTSPVWNQTFGFSADLFDDQTYITLELYGFVELNWEVFFGGGAELTIGDIRNHRPHTFHLPLVDQFGNEGTLTLAWK